MELVIAGLAVLLVIYPFVYPRWRKWEIAREKKRNPRKVSAGGLVGRITISLPEEREERRASGSGTDGSDPQRWQLAP